MLCTGKSFFYRGFALLLLTAGAGAASGQIATDTSMAAKVAEQKKLDSLAALFPRYSNYMEYSPESLTRLRVLGRIPAAVTRRRADPLTLYVITMDTTGDGINLTTMDSVEARAAIESIEMVLYHDTLIRASVFYDENKGDLWEKYYFRGDFCFLGTALPFDMLVQTNLDFREFPVLAGKLEQAAK